MREQWLRDMVAQGQGNHIITDEDAAVILGQLKEPFIQKYLKSLVVHICTAPVTQIVSICVAWIYTRTHPELSDAESAAAIAIAVPLVVSSFAAISLDFLSNVMLPSSLWCCCVWVVFWMS